MLINPTYRLYKSMFMHSSKRFFVGEPVKKLFSVALLLWRECVYVVSKIWSINR